MYSKKNGRVTFRSNRRPGYKRSNFSNSKVRNKGNITQQYQKYLKLAKEASSTGDRIQTEYYYQFADHYSRLMLELGIAIEDNENQNDTVDQKPDVKKNIEDNKVVESEASNDSSQNDESSNTHEDHDPGSIDSIPFISQPAKKKIIKKKKV